MSTLTVSPADPAMLDFVQKAAQQAGTSERALRLQALLQLPRLADSLGRVDLNDARELINELALELPPLHDFLVGDPHLLLHDLEFSEVSEIESAAITRQFHYLQSPRADSRSYGLLTPDRRVATLCVSSPLDVSTISALLRGAGRCSASPRVISRVFSFEGVPRNALSRLFSLTSAREREFGTSDFVTYINPNLGFTGVSYKASGWYLLGDEPGTKYRYLDGRYITDRELLRQFETNDDQILRHILGSRFAATVMELKPLMIMHRVLSPHP